jgi:2-polyprenyl-6-methoxyphenol hydroxylase-like FAD-dependent oxidoreductase
MCALRVAIAGGGLGGLCLAQGLIRAGVEVTVYERDASPSPRRQGYRLHVDARAGLALQACLPPETFAMFLATCGRAGKRFTVLSEKLRVLREIPGDPDRDPYAPETLTTSVNRATLREVLTAGIEKHIRYGHEVIGFDERDDGVLLRFADGSTAEADVLVGADGVNSAVRRRLLPHADVVDSGTRCIYGRTPLTSEALRLVPPSLFDGFTAIVGGAVGMATGLVLLRNRPETVSPALSPADDYLMWAVSASAERFGRTMPSDAPGLHELAVRMIRGWHPDIRRLVALADVDETFGIAVRTSVPVPPWTPGRVTVLGDAIHAMSPARGSGANTALQDAALLAECLTDGAPITDAIGRYEEGMRDYGYAAVRASAEAEASMGGPGGPLFWLYRRVARR